VLWHPDKFLSRFGALIPNAATANAMGPLSAHHKQQLNNGSSGLKRDAVHCLDLETPSVKILKGVDMVAQQITQLMGTLVVHKKG